MIERDAIFEQKILDGFIPDDNGEWYTIEEAIKRHHIQPDEVISKSTDTFFDTPIVPMKKPSSDPIPETKERDEFVNTDGNVSSEETGEFEYDLISNLEPPIITSIEINEIDSAEDTAEHIIPNIKEPENSFGKDKNDTVVINREEISDIVEEIVEKTPVLDSEAHTLDTKFFQKSTVLIESNEDDLGSELDGISDDFGDIIDSFANSSDNTEIPNIEENIAAITSENLNDESEEPVVDDIMDLTEILEVFPDKSKQKQPSVTNEKIDDADDWDRSNKSLFSKFLYLTILLISIAILGVIIFQFVL